MKEPISIVLADSSEDYRKIMSDMLSSEEDMQLLDAVDNGIDGLQQVRTLRPDVLVCDLLLRGMDGTELIRSIKRERLRTRIVVVSSFTSEVQTAEVANLGVDFFILKPCRYERITESIRECSKKLEEGGNVVAAVSSGKVHDERLELADAVLLGCGMIPYLYGYKYLKAAFEEIFADRSMLQGVSKVLYPKLAQRFDTGKGNIERCIRSAIDFAWRSDSKWEKLFGAEVQVFPPEKPGNVRFMKMVLEFVDRKAEGKY